MNNTRDRLALVLASVPLLLAALRHLARRYGPIAFVEVGEPLLWPAPGAKQLVGPLHAYDEPGVYVSDGKRVYVRGQPVSSEQAARVVTDLEPPRVARVKTVEPIKT